VRLWALGGELCYWGDFGQYSFSFFRKRIKKKAMKRLVHLFNKKFGHSAQAGVAKK